MKKYLLEILLALAVTAIIVSAYIDERIKETSVRPQVSPIDLEWIQFTLDHNCVIVAQEGGRPIKLPSGKDYVQNADAVSYLCDDGILYRRTK